MKRYIFSIFLSFLSLGAFAQEDVTLFFLNDGSFKGFYDEEIDSITYSHLDLDSIWHSNAVVQEVWLNDSVVRIPIEDIDSICHKIPDPVYKPGTIVLDERYLPYISSVEGMTITFLSSLPDNLRPHEDDVLYFNGISNLFPEGFAGKVISSGSVVTCEQVDIPDIYEKFVFFGKYTLVKKEKGNSQSYALRRIIGRNEKAFSEKRKAPKKSEGDKDDDFGIGDGSFPDFNLGTFKEAFEFELKDYHVKIKTSFKETPVFSIEYAYAFNFFQPLLFYKCTKTVDYENNYSIAYALDYNPMKDEGFWKKVGDVDKFQKIDFDLLNDLGIYQLSRDEKDRGTVYFFDKKCPIPECPLIQVGAKVGFFVTPKLEGELVLGAKTKGKYESAYIYNLDKNHWLHLSDDWKDYLLPWRFQTGKYLKMGEGQEYPGTRTCETEWYLDGSAKGSIWAGLVAGANISAGFGDNLEAKEEATFRIGPYIEGEIKLNISDGISEWSRYSLLQDSHVKIGVKLGANLAFSAKMKSDFLGCDVGFKWDQLDWTPKHLLWEKTWYFLPRYEAPQYTVRGNSLICSANVSRLTFPNTIGFALFDEQGEVTRKYMTDTYKQYEADNPFYMSLTFDGLDFVNHRYTIVPTSNMFTVDWMKFDAPDKYRTTVLCPNSNHPHLIDLGLPSRTKWLCSNVYADAPKDDGGYYQWGKPWMVHVYNNAIYRPPYVQADNYQGSEFDAATANLGKAYVTPTLAQFNELFDNCGYTWKKSPWGTTLEGVYLKGKNGNNLYLPFGGLKVGSSVKDDFEETGCYLISDTRNNIGEYIHEAFYVEKNGRAAVDAQGYGYSVRPVSASEGEVSLEPQRLDFDEVLIVGENLGTVHRNVVVTNNSTSDVSLTVAQAQAPFTVDAASLGTFTLKPKESKSIYIGFEPTEVKDYSTLLNILYDVNNVCTVCKIPLKGKGVEKLTPKIIIDVDPLNIDFGTVYKGTTKEEQLTVTNIGEDVLIFTIGDPGEYFTISESGLEQKLSVGESKQFKITYLGNLEIGESLQKHVTIDSNARNIEEGFGVDLNVQGGNYPPLPEPVVKTFTANGVSFNMVAVEGGTFMMGAPDNDVDADDNERPQHQVTLDDYYIGESEVTLELWRAIMNFSSSLESDEKPAHLITWGECQSFVNTLSKLTGLYFRLPTEAEWEFAARGGNYSRGYPYSGGNRPFLKTPNELGIYGMSNQRAEWCLDIYGDYTDEAQTNPIGPYERDFARVIRDFRGEITGRYYYEPYTQCAGWLGLRIVLDCGNNYVNGIYLGGSNGRFESFYHGRIDLSNILKLPYDGENHFLIRICEDKEMALQVESNQITLDGTKGEILSPISSLNNMEPKKRYYYQISYFDKEKAEYVNCSPVLWFVTRKA